MDLQSTRNKLIDLWLPYFTEDVYFLAILFFVSIYPEKA